MGTRVIACVVAASLLGGCFARRPRAHTAAYLVDGAVAGTGVIVLMVGGLSASGCINDDCRNDSRVTAFSGLGLAAVGVAGAIVNAMIDPAPE